MSTSFWNDLGNIIKEFSWQDTEKCFILNIRMKLSSLFYLISWQFVSLLHFCLHFIKCTFTIMQQKIYIYIYNFRLKHNFLLIKLCWTAKLYIYILLIIEHEDVSTRKLLFCNSRLSYNSKVPGYKPKFSMNVEYSAIFYTLCHNLLFLHWIFSHQYPPISSVPYCFWPTSKQTLTNDKKSYKKGPQMNWKK
jgi:hypothetical protein